MEKFETENPGATYSLVRISSEYWNLFTTPKQSQGIEIFDPSYRIWECKDYPPSFLLSGEVLTLAVVRQGQECRKTCRVHHRAVHKLLASESEGLIGANVKSRVDTILVMGKDEMACKLWTTRVFALAYGLPTDLARSFVKVDAGFLRRLPEVWWE